jgi:hypothetical protein
MISDSFYFYLVFSFGELSLLSTYMAKSGHKSAQSPQSAQIVPSMISGGWYPLALVRSDMISTLRGQNSTQNPQPLHRSSRMWMTPWETGRRFWSRGGLQYFTIPLSLLQVLMNTFFRSVVKSRG